jgi:hypothetical protein
MTLGQIVTSVAVGLVTCAIAYWLAFHAAYWLRNHKAGTVAPILPLRQMRENISGAFWAFALFALSLPYCSSKLRPACGRKGCKRVGESHRTDSPTLCCSTRPQSLGSSRKWRVFESHRRSGRRAAACHESRARSRAHTSLDICRSSAEVCRLQDEEFGLILRVYLVALQKPRGRMGVVDQQNLQ